jgi:hypothetical protein
MCEKVKVISPHVTQRKVMELNEAE